MSKETRKLCWILFLLFITLQNLSFMGCFHSLRLSFITKQNKWKRRRREWNKPVNNISFVFLSLPFTSFHSIQKSKVNRSKWIGTKGTQERLKFYRYKWNRSEIEWWKINQIRMKRRHNFRWLFTWFFSLSSLSEIFSKSYVSFYFRNPTAYYSSVTSG